MDQTQTPLGSASSQQPPQPIYGSAPSVSQAVIPTTGASQPAVSPVIMGNRHIGLSFLIALILYINFSTWGLASFATIPIFVWLIRRSYSIKKTLTAAIGIFYIPIGALVLFLLFSPMLSGSFLDWVGIVLMVAGIITVVYWVAVGAMLAISYTIARSITKV